MDKPEFRLHHFAFLTKDIRLSMAQFLLLGYVCERDVFTDADRAVDAAFLRADSGALVELISPSSADSPVAALTEKLSGNFYHSCYCVADMDAAASYLRKNGFFMADKPRPASGFGGRRIAFMFSAGAGLVELLEEKSDSEQA